MTSQKPYSSYEPPLDIEYVHMELPNGEPVRFKRSWGEYRFTDYEAEMLKAGMEIRINTAYVHGIIGSLDWQEYKGYDYFGFAPWDAEAYMLENAPFPVKWNNHEFTDADKAILRKGEKLLLMCTSNRTGSQYAVNVTYGIVQDNLNVGHSRWGIIPHFEEFDMPASDFTRDTCLFTPMFGGQVFTQAEITQLRSGEALKFKGLSKNDKPYSCTLSLELDTQQNRWRLQPNFN